MIDKGLHLTIPKCPRRISKTRIWNTMGARPPRRVIENKVKIPLGKRVIADKSLLGLKLS